MTDYQIFFAAGGGSHIHGETKMITDRYADLRRPYRPEHLKLIIVAESPPASHKYLYDPTGKKSEPLFAALMEHVAPDCRSKEEGLSAFQRKGWILLDATYEPVNKKDKPEREAIIARDYPLLCECLDDLTPDRSAPVIVMVRRVYPLIHHKLLRDGFNVINGPICPPFPGRPQWKHEFREQFGALIRNNADHPGTLRPNDDLTPFMIRRAPPPDRSAGSN